MLFYLLKLVGWNPPVPLVDWNVILTVDSVMRGGLTAELLPLPGKHISILPEDPLCLSLFCVSTGKLASSTPSGGVSVFCCCATLLGVCEDTS